MQQQTGKPARLPDRCPQHPYSRTVITSTKGAITADGLLTLTQHRCGEPGCNQGTGWIYVGPGQASRSGSGACEGQELLDGMAQAAHEHLANAAYAMIVVMTAFAIAGTWMYLSFSQDHLWSLNHTAAALTLPVATAALTWATRLVLQARAPRRTAASE